MLISQKILTTIFLIFLSVLAPHAQEQQSRPVIDFDQFPGETFTQEKARLDRFAQFLKKAPSSARGFIIAYGGQKGRAGEAKNRAKMSKDYLVRKHGIAASRIVAIDGGYREMVEVEHFIVPANVEGPTPSPSIAPSEVHLKRRRVVKWNR
jgi:hypothetical protein